jgi:hypothetical protein
MEIFLNITAPLKWKWLDNEDFGKFISKFRKTTEGIQFEINAWIDLTNSKIMQTILREISL